MKRVLAVVMALAVLIVAGCSASKTSDNAPSEKPAETQKPADNDTEKSTGPEELVVGFVPSQEADQVSDKVQPMADYLTEKLGIPTKIFVGTNYAGVIEAMGSEQVDIAFLNPLGYVLAHDEYEVEVLLKSVRYGSDKYRAQLNVRADLNVPVCNREEDPNCLKTFEALKGKKMAFVDPASTSGYMYPAAMMKAAGVDYEGNSWFASVTFAGQHDAGAKAVYNGAVDASWSFDDVRSILKKELPDIKEKVVVAAYTDWIPNDTVSVRKGLPADLKEKIEQAFLEYAGTEEGKKVLKELYSIDGFAVAKNADYDVVRDMVATLGINLREELK